jgi:hypothetical protein
MGRATRRWVKRNRQTAEARLLGLARSRARAAGVRFDIDVSDVVIPKRCPILDILLRRGRGRPSPASPSLDRIIPDLGYVKGNVMVISYRANMLKNNAPPCDLIAVARASEFLTLRVQLAQLTKDWRSA